MKKFQIGLNLTAILILVLVIALVLITKKSFSNMTSHIVLTISLLLFEVSTCIDIIQDKKENKISYNKIGRAIAFVLIAVLVWVCL